MMNRHVFLFLGLLMQLHSQELPLQKEQDRVILRRQSGEVFDIVTPIAQKARKSTVWVWADGKQQLCIGTVIGDGSQVLAKWSEVAKARGMALQCVGDQNATFDATLSGVYEDEDLAVLQLKDSTLRPLSTSTLAKPNLGQILIAAGPGDATLGMGIVSVNERVLRDRDQAFVGIGIENHPQSQEVMITQVADGSPAAKAGLKANDVILGIGGHSVSSMLEFRSKLALYKPGEQIPLEYQRDGKKAVADLILGSKETLGQFPQRRLEVMERMGGEISQVREGFPSVIQTDIIIQPEECGGPVVNLQGEWVGIAAARAGRIRSYVIPATVILEMLKRQPTRPELAKVRAVEPEPQLSRTRQVRPRLKRSDMERMRARMREMQQFMKRLDEELGSLDR